MTTRPDAIAPADKGTDPRQVLALLQRADAYAAAGDTRSASSFYLAALRAAGSQAGRLAPELQAGLRRAQEATQRYAREYRDYLLAELGTRGFDPGRSSPRFRESLEIVFGERRIFVPQPRYYYFPGMPIVQFAARESLPWLGQVERETDAIRAELLQVLDEPGAFAPYVTGHPNRPRKSEQGMLDNPDWSAFYLWKNGEPVEANLAKCPSVMRAMQGVPLAQVSSRSPSILFSLLRPGTHIPPHNGLVNTRLICHLPLIVPEKCRFRVGNEVRRWETGRAWAFDDTIEHEAWNESDQTRVILLFDVWRPELTAEERSLVTAMFAAIDAYSGQKPDWEI